jgi:NADH pyrophosphatase NudC (nudix superfamily)
MSSETSSSPAGSTASLPSWQLFALAGLIGATLVVFVSRGQSPAAIILLSLVIFAAAATGAAALRTLLPFVEGRDALNVSIVAGRARAAIDREKTLVLRSIKELEFDHAMGKVSDQDFAEMGLRLRTRAAGLLRQLDAGTAYSMQIEQELAKRLAAAGVAPVAREDRFCTQCGTPVAASARFCGQCGHKLEIA